MTAETFDETVERLVSAAERQGLPRHVENEAVLQRLAVVLRGSREAAERREGGSRAR